MHTSDKLPTDGLNIPGGTYHNPELDLLARREAYGVRAAYDHSVHDHQAVGSQVSVLNSVAFRHSTRVEVNDKWVVVLVHSRVPFRGTLVWDNWNKTCTRRPIDDGWWN